MFGLLVAGSVPRRRWERSGDGARGLRRARQPELGDLQYSPLITKKEPRIVPASFDLCRANLNREASSSGTSIPSDSLNPTARFAPAAKPYITLTASPES